MLSNLPAYVTIIFILSVIFALYLLFRASYSAVVIIVSVVWLTFNGVLTYQSLYLGNATNSSRIILAMLPAFLLIIVILATKKGNKFTRRLDLRALHLVHVVRIPVELCLYWLFLQKAVPRHNTFAGNNFDIITGITAAILFVTCFRGRSVRSVNLLFGWNILGIVMLGSAVVNSMLSLPISFQKYGFENPDIAVLHFPFVWLPTFIVPVLLFSHLVMIKRLMEK